MTLARKITDRFRLLREHPAYRRHPARVLARAVAWSLHCLLRIPARAKFRRWNYRLYLTPKWRGGGSTSPFLFREDYEPELMLLEQYLKPGMVFVDGGANTGVFSSTAARLVGPQGRVLAFEPGASCYAALRQSQSLNSFSQMKIYNQALSDRSGTARLYHCLGQENSFSLGADASAAFEEITTGTLDEIATREQLARVDFIKLDVEGAEELVLRGADNVLDQWRPIVLFEVNREAAQRLNLSAGGACQLLRDYGYELFSLDDDLRLMPAAELPDAVRNLLAIPKVSVPNGDEMPLRGSQSSMSSTGNTAKSPVHPITLSAVHSS